MRDSSRGGTDPSNSRHLQLVHPSPPRKPKASPKPYTNDLFTAEESSRLRAALRTAHDRFGTWPKLADAMGVPVAVLSFAMSGRNRVTGPLAIKLSRALKTPLETLLQGVTAVPAQEGITAEQVHRVLVALAADEIRVAEENPRPLTIAKLADHAGSAAFCASLAREAANDTAVIEANRRVQEYIRRPSPKRGRS